MIREIAPGFVALAIGARAGTAISAEIANMQVTSQVDAIKTLKIDPNSLFGEGSADYDGSDSDSSSSSDDGDLSQSEIIAKAQEAFDKAQDAQRNGNWAKYGEYLNELDKYLNMLN